MTNIIVSAGQHPWLELDSTSDAHIPTRSYDLNKGDRRFASQAAAVAWADDEAVRTGVRQVVRVDPGSYPFQKLYLVQAVGS